MRKIEIAAVAVFVGRGVPPTSIDYLDRERKRVAVFPNDEVRSQLSFTISATSLGVEWRCGCTCVLVYQCTSVLVY